MLPGDTDEETEGLLPRPTVSEIFAAFVRRVSTPLTQPIRDRVNNDVLNAQLQEGNRGQRRSEIVQVRARSQSVRQSGTGARQQVLLSIRLWR